MKRKRTSKLAKAKADPNSRYWRNKADAEWSRCIRSIGRCEAAGVVDSCAGPLNAAHLISDTRLDLRHDLRNGLCLCAKHHKWGRAFSYHAQPMLFLIWLTECKPNTAAWLGEQGQASEEVNFREAYGRLRVLCIDAPESKESNP